MGTDGTARSRTSIWLALAGTLLLAALAFGLLQAGANATPPVSAGGYGDGGSSTTGNGAPECSQVQGGYSVPCAADVRAVTVKPRKPAAGKGFKVSFKSKSGGSYTVDVVRKGKTTELESGATGTGKTTTERVGKSLKAGKYKLVAKVESGGTTDTAKVTLKIAK